jgi:betaine-aldehyde dehydrogenase
MRTLENFINGKFVAPAGGETEPVLNPASGEEIAQAPLSTEADVDAAVIAARSAFDGWSQTTPATRAEALLKLADAIEAHAEELAREEAINAGKPLAAVLGDEIPVMADNLRFFAGAAARWRAVPRASTSRATPPSSAASRLAWSARSRRGTTR